MAPHSDKRIQQASASGGRKRAAPGSEGRDKPPRKDSKSVHVAEKDPARSKASSSGGKPSSSKPSSNSKPSSSNNNNSNDNNNSKKGGVKGAGPTITKPGKGKAKAQGKGTIDDIFSGVKRLKEGKKEEEVQRAAKKKKMKEEHKRRQANPFTGEGGPEKRWKWADEVKPVRFDDEGLPIYTWDSLRIGQGGGTDQCPFDCDCCF